MGQARYEAVTDRVGDQREYNRDGLRLAGKRGCCRGRRCQQHVGLQPDKLSCECVQQIDVAAAPAYLDPHIAAFGPAELGKMPCESREQCLTFWIGGGITHEHPDPPNLIGLLRVRRERPCYCCTADERNELPPPHSITSSARPSSESGTLSPRALAALRLIIISTLVACRTGISAGRSPLRIRPA